jgi:ankyrin repeat protein
MLTDGTSIEGYVFKQDSSLGPRGSVAKPYFADLSFFWAYSVAYSTTGDEFMWKMARDIALGNKYGDIGESPSHTPKLIVEITYSDVYGLLGFLELYRKTKSPEFLKMAQCIGNNIVNNQFYKGFFVPSKRHIYTRFDCFEPLALLHLHAATTSEMRYVPQVWPSSPLFVPPYRYKEQGVDLRDIYTLIESPEPPMSLQEAAVIGDANMVRTLLDKGVGVDSWDDSLKKTALHRAAISGYKDVVELLLAKGADIDAGRFDIGTALHYAVENNYKEISELLISRGADVNAKRGDGDTPLHSAARAHKEIVELLIANGADVNAKNNDGQTPVAIASNRNRKDIVELLVEKGAVPSSIHAVARFGILAGVKALLEQGLDVNAQDDEGLTPLHCAVQGGHKEIAELLIANGADINSKDKEGHTSLYYAVSNEDKDMVEFLVTKGADVHLVPEKGYPLLSHAVWSGNRDIVELLVAHGARFDVKDQDGFTAFRYAASQGNRELVEFFVAKGADISSLHMAACVGDLARVESFVEEGAGVDAKDELGWTPLYWAASTGQEEVAKFLIANGANVNVGANNNRTSLHQAAQAGWQKLAELFISEGAEVDVKDKRGDTPLYRAVLAGHRAVVDLLIAKGANVNEKNRNGQTPLYRAVQRGHKDVVEVLIAKGADINAKVTNLSQTFLHIAVVGGRKDIAALLIAKGIDVNSKNVNGQTPLHLSVRQGSRDIAELLIANGADMNVKNRWNRTPLDLATDRGHTEIVELLKKHAVDIKVSSESKHDVAITGISALTRGLKDYTVPVIVNLENQGNCGESFNVKLIDITESAIIGTKSVHLSPAGVDGMDEVSDMIFTSPAGDPGFFGQYVNCGGDVNGDGYNEIIISAPRWNKEKGRTYLYYGGSNIDTNPDMIFKGEHDEERLGEGLSLGDLNGDGYDDVILGACKYRNYQGRVYVFLGGPEMDQKYDLVFDGEEVTTGAFGYKILVGDVDNDNCDDLLLTAPAYAPIAQSWKGRAYLYYGGDPMDTICDRVFEGENIDDHFGIDAVIGGDVDGDGYKDILIGALLYPGRNPERGRAYLYYGNDKANMDTTCDVVFECPESGQNQFGYVEMVDIDKDGHADVLVGARFALKFRGRVYLYWGSERADMDAIPDKFFTGEKRSNDQLSGNSIHHGYFNNDNYPDIAVGAHGWHDFTGRVHVYYGNEKALIDESSDKIFTGVPQSRFGVWFGVGDLNNDRYDDIVVGGYMYNKNQGRAWLYYGSPGDSRQLKFDWDTTNASSGKHTLKVEIPPIPGEKDISNNTMNVTVEVKEPSK